MRPDGESQGDESALGVGTDGGGASAGGARVVPIRDDSGVPISASRIRSTPTTCNSVRRVFGRTSVTSPK